MNNLFKNTALALSLSSLLVTEKSLVGTIILISSYLIFHKFVGLFGTIIGVINYCQAGFSGGFIAGIFCAIWDFDFIKRHSKILTILAALVFIFSLIFLTCNKQILHSAYPFKLTWWFDLVLCFVVSVVCSEFVSNKPC